NTGSASFTVTVTDGENPVVTVPDDISVFADAGLSSATVTYAAPTATDNVGVTSGPSLTAGLASGGAFPMGITTVTYQALDAENNTGSASFTVTVTDGEAPVVTVPADIIVSTDPGLATAVVTYPAVTATDNVAVTAGPDLTVGLLSGATFPLGTTVVTYQATDGDTNIGTASFNVTVEDNEAPVIRPIGAVSFEADPSGTREITFSAIVDDNVDTGIAPVFRLDGNVITPPYDFPVGLNAITINATDTEGNAAVEVIFNLTIVAGQAPDVPDITTSVINADRSMTIGGTAETDSTVRVTFPDTTFQEVTATGGAFIVTSAALMTGGTVTVTSTDDRGYTSLAATVDLFPDYDQPTVAITGAPTRVIDESPFTVTITFSENVTGFVLGDIGVTGANVAAFAGTGAVYTAEITPIAGEAVVLSVAGGVAQDDFANLNVASDVISIENAALTETEEMITQVMQSRNAALIATQPRIGRFLLGGQFGSFNLNVTQGVGNFDLTTSSERPVWLAGQGRWSTEGALETSYFNLAVGGHIAMTENVLLGAMAQFDSTVSDEAVMTFESTGWLVGPYAVLRMADQPLVFSASYLMGQTTNTLSPFGTYEDEFSSDRSILTLGVTGKMELTSVTLIPRLDLAHVTDESEAYTDGDSNLVRAQTVTMTDATIGLDFVMPIDVANGALELIGGIGATSSRFDNGVEETDDTRGQTELGFRYTMESGGLVTARATYDGLGQDDYEAVGAEVSFEISF
ncbi:HYR domain-containing protein, partial [Yoonia sp.]|uniref:HYR domain-containing protein n=1 Tax=Yoonia sp. TaxID=2212373 RepID=UPI0025F3D9FB